MIFYRFLLVLIAPVATLLALRQILRGKETLADVKERLGAGLDAAPIYPGRTLWFHGASNGELTAARPLIEQALARDERQNIIVTVNSISARALVNLWDLDRVTVRLAPLDFKRTVHHFLTCTQPDALISIENELWPNRYTLCARYNVPVIVVGARMSEETAETWQKYQRILGGVTQATLQSITALAPQDKPSQDRLIALGLDPAHILPMMNLKSDVDATQSMPADASALSAAFDKSNTMLAASTHAGEDDIVLEAYASLTKLHPDLRLILAPRHPARADQIAKSVEAAGFRVARRSLGTPPASDSIYLADTLGEMALWYAVAGITLVGGSLVDRGGHTPFEPAQFGTVILHGPYVSNHADAFAALDAAGGALLVHDADQLTATVDALLLAPQYALELSQAGTLALQDIRTSQETSFAFWEKVEQIISQKRDV
ncbi:3-deoxy-D-manno-octulosonic-acid transferase [Pacificibacter maritimus]|uniref:3-deoxy-D-manno-octulosonic acid transferase n=1 Tax=Pacificibacter maritimus TaxID=762213 RepID=A0A3N4U988_9RHOB|nr:glycosyltransferase N-terminal domain-containing protein [Pacificibacter maritimus]RPE67032.1 3-deoxy-D-manno-octulosonic-acid transferase [Pacificibacter maritimus]